MGKRPFRWTVPIYSMTRCSALGAMVCYMIGLNATHKIDCPMWLTATFTLSYASLALASGLLAMRAIALWNRNIIVITINGIAWLVNAAFMIYAMTLASSSCLGTRDEAYWNPSSKSCTTSGTGAHNLDAITTMIVDIILLGSMLTGIRRTKNPGTLWKYLYHQGLAWTALATFAEVPIVTLLELDLNDPMNLIFQPITLTILNIGSTRLYRNLAIYATSPERLHPINIERIECPPISPPPDGASFCSHGYTRQSQGIEPINFRSKVSALKRLILAGSLTASDISQLPLSSDI
ncbi:hypothetical protein F5146DRAFT_1228631 [Armillaria mellea]|nr:hypothetical protein F5146DRAFT_1228631 [Armillaria mellea]